MGNPSLIKGSREWLRWLPSTILQVPRRLYNPVSRSGPFPSGRPRPDSKFWGNIEVVLTKRKFKVTVDGEVFIVEVEEIGALQLDRPPSVPSVTTTPRKTVEAGHEAVVGLIVSPLPGVVSDIRVVVGDTVNPSSVLLVLEAMKMENEIYAPSEGVVKEVYVELGQQVSHGDKLVLIS